MYPRWKYQSYVGSDFAAFSFADFSDLRIPPMRNPEKRDFGRAKKSALDGALLGFSEQEG
jgi:hypothetical protein